MTETATTNRGVPGDWVATLADRVVAAAERRGITGPITSASGISPSGPIHLGNLREVMVPHLVHDELQRRGIPARHLLSWDDYDRLRKVPAGVDESFAQHIGRPLTAVPDPDGCHESWSEHFKAPFRAALAQLGVEVEEISQTAQYTGGAYRSPILHAMSKRREIFDVLDRYRTLARDAGAAEDDSEETGTLDEREAYSPYKPYCRHCGRDLTTVTSYDDSTTELAYRCDCGHTDSFRLDAVDHGKLVWKVDWPMRWAYENVVFEAGGVDHSSPGSSFTVGSELVSAIFDGEPPEYVPYSFVGTDGAAKMSSSRGGAPTPTDALAVIEAPILRRLYCREPRKSFTIAFNEKLANLYDEWDRLSRNVAAGKASAGELATHTRSVGSATVTLPTTPRPLHFRSLASVIDITQGDEAQLRRIAEGMAEGGPLASLDELRPRLDRATTWVWTYLPEAERTHVRDTPDTHTLGSLDPTDAEAIRLLVDGLDDNWSLDGLTTLVYGIPKQQRGIPVDSKEKDPELQAAQRAFFALLYRLLVGRDTGPRLPTLLLAVGADRIRALLTPPDGS